MKIKDNIVSEFDEFSKNYTQDMIKCVPHYGTLLSSFIDHLPPNFQPKSILDLGCGNGNVTATILKTFPDANYTLIDASQEMINLCKQRFQLQTIKHITSYFQDFEFKENHYDYIVAGFSLHHCDAEDKKDLFKKIYGSLNADGIFSCSDLMINKNNVDHPNLIKQWKAFVLDNYSNNEKWEWLMEHYNEYDKPDNYEDQLEWLKKAGFNSVKMFANETYWIHYQSFKD
ncbi:MAG: class I SAM-dependent methyltransferase [Aquaticitalea sp.]